MQLEFEWHYCITCQNIIPYLTEALQSLLLHLMNMSIHAVFLEFEDL